MRPPLPLKTLLGWGGILLFSLALAARGVGISPPRYEFFLAPGERTSGVFHVFTTETEAQGVEMELLDYVQAGDGTFVFLPGGSIPYSLAPYLVVSLNPFEVVAERDQTIPFTVTAPKNGEGSYWVAIAFTTRQVRETNAKGIQVTQQVRVLGAIYVTVSGIERPDAALETLKAEGNTLTAIIANTGNTYLRLKPVILLKNQNGETIYEKEEDEFLLLREARIRRSWSLPEDQLEKAVVAAVELRAAPPIPLPATPYMEVPLR